MNRTKFTNCADLVMMLLRHKLFVWFCKFVKACVAHISFCSYPSSYKYTETYFLGFLRKYIWSHVRV
jgi:hypothetical protein